MCVCIIDANLMLYNVHRFKHIFSLPARSPCSICYAYGSREDGECIRECIHIDCPEFLGYELPCVDAEAPEGECCGVCPNGTSHEVISCYANYPTIRLCVKMKNSGVIHNYVDNKRRSRGVYPSLYTHFCLALLA